LLRDLFCGVRATQALPGGHIGEQSDVHSLFLLGDRTISVFFRNVKYRKIKIRYPNHSFHFCCRFLRD